MGHTSVVRTMISWQSTATRYNPTLESRLFGIVQVSKASKIVSNQTRSSAVSGAQIIVETLYALLALASIVLFGLRQTSLLSPALQNLAQLTDYIVCILFATKAVWDLWRAPNKLKWLKWGWADFAASIPEVEFLRFLRGLRLLLIIRVMRSTTRSVHSIVTYFNVGRARAVVATVFFSDCCLHSNEQLPGSRC